jgi:Tol biopolymer transport system component
MKGAPVMGGDLKRVAAILAGLNLIPLSCKDQGPETVDPVWNFNGGIIFELNAGSRVGGVCVINPDETNPLAHQLLSGAIEARLSPDGKKLLQTRLPGNTHDLFVTNPDGTDACNLTNTDRSISESDGDWAPDMQYVVCHVLYYPSYREAIRLIPLDGTLLSRNITDTSRVRTANLPRWSPDGGRIAYLGQDTLGGSLNLTLIAPDGSREQWVGAQTGLVAPVWSLDGQKLAWAGVALRGLRVFDISSGQSLILEEGALAGSRFVCWLPDGRLVFVTHTNESFEVKVANLSPSLQVTSLAAGFSSFEGLVLSPQMNRLAIFGRKEESSLSLYNMGVDGSGLRRVGTVDPSPQARVPTNGNISWVE